MQTKQEVNQKEVELIPEEKLESTSTVKISNGKKIVLGAISALALAVVMSGSALVYAQSTNSEKPFLDRVAQIAGVDSTKLKDAFKQASNEIVDEKVAAGTITEEQAKNIKEKIANEDFRGPGFGGPGMKGGHKFGLRQDFAEVAEFLGMEEKDLMTELQNGKTLVQIGATKGKTEAQLRELLSTKFDERVKKALDDKNITEDQANKMKEKKDEMINRLLTGTMPEPRGGMRIRDGED